MYIIAEVGSNYRDKYDCLESVRLAKESGADAVKFQMFTHKELYGYGSEAPLGIDPDWVSDLANEAIHKGIDFGCTTFSAKSMKWVDQFVDFHKIASSDSADPFMVNTARSLGKHIIISVGGKTWKQCRDIALTLMDTEYTMLYCVSDYPAKDLNCFKMNMIDGLVPRVGFSDHTLSCAPVYYADVYEKHVNLMGVTDTPDEGHSLNLDEFKKFVSNCRDVEPEWGSDSIEDSFLKMHNKRLVITSDAEVGEELVFGKNYGIHRIKEENILQIEPKHWEKFNGKRLKRKVYQGEALRLSDVK